MNKLLIAALLSIAVLIAVVPAAFADSPLDCPGVPHPTVADAQGRLKIEPELYVVASEAGLPAVNTAAAKIQFDFCYGQANTFGTDAYLWGNSYWTRAQLFAKLVGVTAPYQTFDGPSLSFEFLTRVPTFRHIWELE